MSRARNNKTVKNPQSPGRVSDSSTGNPTILIPKWAPLALMALTAIIYSRALQNGITFMDDDYYLIKNPYIRDASLHGIKAIFTSFFNFNYHPLTTLTYLAEYTFFGLNPLPYHLVNVSLHVLNVWLVYQLTEKLSGRQITAIIVSSLFALHPMHVESVAWISETKDVLYSAFYLSSLLIYLRYINSGFRTKYYTGTLLLFIAALLSKSAAVTLPVLLIAVDLYKGRTINTKNIIEKAPFFALSILFAVVTIMSQRSGGALQDLSLTYNFIDRVFLLTHNISFYLLKLIAPFGLSGLHYFPDLNGGILPVAYYFSLPLILIIIWLVIKSLKNTAMRRDVIFGCVFFLVTISVMLQIITVGLTLTAERYTYIPYIGLFYIAAQWVSNKMINANKKVIIGAVTGLMIIFSAQTWARIAVWKDTDTLFTDITEKNPDNPHNSSLYNFWGDSKYYEGRLPDALSYYTKAIALYPGYERAHYNKGVVDDKLGNVLSAISDFNKAISLNSRSALYHNDRGWAYYESGNKQAALSDYNKAISLDPNYASAYNNRGWAYYEAGDTVSATADFDKAILLEPGLSKSRFNRAVIRAATGNLNGAIEDYTAIIGYNSKDALAYFDRGVILFKKNDKEGACKDWHRAVELGNVNATQLIKQYCR